MPALGLLREGTGLRRRLTEPEWAAVLGVAPGPVPGWAEPLAPTGGAPRAADVVPDAALRDAVGLGAGALLEVEVSAVAGRRGVLGVLRTDGVVGSALVRGIDIPPGEDPRLRAGVEVSAFPVARLLNEVLRLVPPAERGDVPDALVPLEVSAGLGRALREGRTATVAAVTADLGLEQPPAVVDALARSLDGRLTLTVRSAGTPTVSVASWLRCRAGWVELVPAPRGMVLHRCCSREDVGRTLLVDLAARLDRAAAGREAG